MQQEAHSQSYLYMPRQVRPLALTDPNGSGSNGLEHVGVPHVRRAPARTTKDLVKDAKAMMEEVKRMKKESKLKKKFLKFEEKRKSLTSTYGMPWRHLRVAFIHQPVDAQVLSTGRSCKRNSRSKLMRRAIKLKVVALPHLVPHHVLCQRQRKPDCARTPMGPAFALDHARRLLCTDFGYISFMFARQITVHQCHEDVVNAASLQEFGFPDPVGAKPKAAQAAQTKSNGQAITLKERTASNLLHSRMPYRMRGMCEARVRCGGTVDSGLTNLPILIKPSSSPHEGFSFQSQARRVRSLESDLQAGGDFNHTGLPHPMTFMTCFCHER